MKYLFVHQNFPGQFLHIVRHLVRSGKHEVVFISEGNANAIPGVRRALYRIPDGAGQDGHPAVRSFDRALTKADAVAKAALNRENPCFLPDIIIRHHGRG